MAHLVDELVLLCLDAVLHDARRRQPVLLVRGQVQLVPLLGRFGLMLIVVMRTLTSYLILRRHPVALLSPVFASVSLLEGKMNNYLSCVVQGDQVQRLPSYYKRFNTGTGEILPCVCCYQLPFRLTLLVVTPYTHGAKH